MVRVERVATQGVAALISMPLLTELVSTRDGFSYKHGAPSGAVPRSSAGLNLPRNYVPKRRECAN